MAQDIPTKKYPGSTAEVASMLGIHGASKDLPMSSFVSHGDLPVADLPVVSEDLPKTTTKVDLVNNVVVHAKTEHATLATPKVTVAANPETTREKVIKALRAGAPYVAVFAVGLFLYYFFFTGVNFSSVLNTVSKPKVVTPTQSSLQQLESGDLTAYYQWINGYYYDVSDTKITAPDTDNSGNGLTNYQKYLLHLNPKAYDTLGFGQADSQTLAAGIDPASGEPLTNAQKALVSKYIDMEVVMNKLTLNHLQHPEQIAGATTNYQGFGNILTPTPTPTQNSAPITGADLSGIGVDINTDIPGRLEIPDLKINVPIIWTKDTNNFETDLETGVVHYPGTAVPGQIGTTYIAGHSSNYVWAKGNYNHVFTHLGDLADNTSFKITVVQKNGKDAIFHYVVTHRGEYLPTDQQQFANTGKSIVALSTCWPINTTTKRLVVFGELTQTEK